MNPMVSVKFAVVQKLLLDMFTFYRTGNTGNTGMTRMLAISKLVRLASVDYLRLTQ